MNAITELFKQDFPSIIIGIFIIMSGIIAVYEIICRFFSIFGKPIGIMKQRKADHELLLKTVKDLTELHNKHEEDTKQSIKHDEMMRKDLLKLTNTVNVIAKNLETMQKKENETKLKELKDSLISYYSKYRNVGEWSKLEKDAFWDLFDDYEKRGGDGYIHSIVEPVMRELREID